MRRGSQHSSALQREATINKQRTPERIINLSSVAVVLVHMPKGGLFQAWTLRSRAILGLPSSHAEPYMSDSSEKMQAPKLGEGLRAEGVVQ